MSDSECYPKADFFRKPNFPKFPNCGFNKRHDNREVTLIEFFESPNLSEHLPNVPKCGLNTRHDNREVTKPKQKTHNLFGFYSQILHSAPTYNNSDALISQ